MEWDCNIALNLKAVENLSIYKFFFIGPCDFYFIDFKKYAGVSKELHGGLFSHKMFRRPDVDRRFKRYMKNLSFIPRMQNLYNLLRLLTIFVSALCSILPILIFLRF